MLGLSPFWLWALWMMFSLTLNASLDFLKNQSLVVIALLGALLGPFNYFAGAGLGAAQLNLSVSNLLTISAVWIIALPTLVYAAKKWLPHQPPSLREVEILQKLSQLDGWTINAAQTSIEKEWNFEDFSTAIHFFCRVGDLAIAQDHHPEGFSNYTKLRIRLFTHDTQGLTDKDFLLASAINALAQREFS